MTTTQHEDGTGIDLHDHPRADLHADLHDDLREVLGVLGCGWPTMPTARSEEVPAPDLAVVAAALEGYEDDAG